MFYEHSVKIYGWAKRSRVHEVTFANIHARLNENMAYFYTQMM